MNSKAQVIMLNSYLVIKVAKAQILLDNIMRSTRRNKQERDEETGKWRDVLDEQGNKVVAWNNILPHDAESIDKTVLQVLSELVEAFEKADE